MLTILLLEQSAVPFQSNPYLSPPPIYQQNTKPLKLDLLDDFDTNPFQPEDEWIGMDKFWHWSFGFLMTGASYHFLIHRLGCSYLNGVIITITSVSIFSIIKEIYDYFRYSLFSYKDLVYDFLGLAAGYLVFIMPWNA